MEDLISRRSIKKKLQEHHDFFVKSNEGWVIPSVITKARIDEITNCIAMVVNEPSVQPKGFVHIDDIYRLISGHSNYHGDNILSALTCLAEGKEVPNPITVLEEGDTE